MKRRLTATLLAVACASFVACGPGVFGLADEADALAKLRVRIDGGADRRLHVGLVWAQSPFGLRGVDPLCASGEFGSESSTDTSTVAAIGCPQSELLLPTEFGSAFEVVERGTTEVLLPINRLPSAAVLRPLGSGRIGTGFVVMFEDTNGDGYLTLESGCGGDTLEPIIASSWDGSLTGTTLVAYREGAVDDIGLAGLVPCLDLPPGFSIVDAAGLGLLGTTCEASPISDVIELVPSADNIDEIACVQQSTRPMRPPPVPPPEEFPMACESETSLVVADPNCGCPYFERYTLIGCEDRDCNDEWDLTNEPPIWWPCEALR